MQAVRLYHRYLATSLFSPLLIITLTLTAMVWLVRSMRFLDLIINNGLSITDFLYLSSLLAPLFVMILLPVALFIAVIHIYNKFINDSELIVLKTAGLSSLTLTKPALSVAAVTTVFCMFISLYVLPNAYREFKDLQLFFRNTSNLSFLQKGVFNSPIKGLTLYIDDKTADGLLQGILVHDRNRKEPITLIAQEGRLVRNKIKNELYLDVLNGRQEIDHGNGQFDVLYFDSYVMDLTHYSKQSATRSQEPEERPLHELIYPEKNLSQAQKSKLIAEGHHRIVWPLLSFTLTYIALAFLLCGQFNRRGQWQRILGASVAGLLIIIADLALKSLTASYAECVVLMYLNALLPIAVCTYILHKGYR